MGPPIESFGVIETAEYVGPIEKIEPEQLEYLQQIEELRPERWSELEVSERLTAIGELETRLAEIQGRLPFQIVAERLPDCYYGYFDGTALHLNERLISLADPREAVETVAHEGRHAYQHYAVEHPGVHGDPKEVAYWEANFSIYLDASMYGFEVYQHQPVEIDARDYAAAVKKGLYA